MKSIMTTIVALGTLSATAGANQIRFWLSRSALDSGDAVTPELSYEPATQALFLWTEPEPGDRWFGISMYADFVPDTTCELVSPSEIFDQLILGVLPQWNPDSDFSFLGDHLAAVVAITEQGLGGPLDTPDDGNAYLIGQLTVHCTACEATEIYLSVGPNGMARQGALPGEDDIYFGWGDDPVSSIDTHIWTALPEAIVCAPIPPYAGDVNCDGTIDFFDIDAFILAYFDAAGYEAAYPDCDILRADCNYDGVINWVDISKFVSFITQE